MVEPKGKPSMGQKPQRSWVDIRNQKRLAAVWQTIKEKIVEDSLPTTKTLYIHSSI